MNKIFTQMRRLVPMLMFASFLMASSLHAQELDKSKYRTYDGTSNNVANPEWGSVGEALRFMVPPAYADGMSAPAGMDRPNPRTLSNDIFAQNTLLNDPLQLSDFCWVWGQFLDHDIGLTPDGNEFFPISVPRGDPWFDPMESGQVVIPMMRNRFDPTTGTSPENPRRHPNLITAFIDGSGVYGSDEERAHWLRSFEGGKMKVSEGNLLPFNTVDGELNSAVAEEYPEMDDAVGTNDKLFVAGDVRANENPLLLAFHTLFVREHNRLVEELAQEHPDWDDEQLYQHGRKMVSGFIQSIVYNEYLPAMGVHLEEYQGYNPNMNPQLANLFTAAAFRLGHTLLNGNLMRMNDDGSEYEGGHLTLRESFFQPLLVMEPGGLDPLLKGMGVQMQQDLDARIIDDVRNFLFGPPGAGGLDLAAVNILRGRERGVPDLNSVRRELGLRSYNIFREINPDNIDVTYRLLRNYQNINRVDLWVGLLSERKMPGALFGETLMEIMDRQFTALRDGDRFYYMNDPVLSGEEKKEISETTLNDIIMRNTGITLMQDNVFDALPHEEICDNMTVDVLGIVRTETGAPVADVGVNVEANNTFITLLTSLNGTYDFNGIPGCGEKKMSLTKDDDHLNGLSTLDLILVQKHILNRERLDSPYKIIAADVDNSGSVSTIDLIKMRKVILSIDLTLNDKSAWEFIPAELEFSDPNDPFADDIPEEIDLSRQGSSNYAQDYIAVKLGDVNGNAVTTGSTQVGAARLDPRSGKTAVLALQDMPIRKGSSYEVTFTAEQFKNLSGYQFGLRFNPEAIEIQDVLAGALDNMTEANFAVLNNEGLIATSWNTNRDEGVSLDKTEAVFSLKFLAKENGYFSDFIGLDQRLINPESYTNNLRTQGVAIEFMRDNQALVAGFELYQNQPNPFTNTTIIPFYIPENEQVEMLIFDASGKVVLQQAQRFESGYNQWNISRTDLPASGIYYYQIASQFGTATKKMIITN